MTDVRRARREAEKAARDALSCPPDDAEPRSMRQRAHQLVTRAQHAVPRFICRRPCRAWHQSLCLQVGARTAGPCRARGASRRRSERRRTQTGAPVRSRTGVTKDVPAALGGRKPEQDDHVNLGPTSSKRNGHILPEPPAGGELNFPQFRHQYSYSFVRNSVNEVVWLPTAWTTGRP